MAGLHSGEGRGLIRQIIKHRMMAYATMAVFIPCAGLHAATTYWIGNGADGSWATAANFSGTVSNNDIVFNTAAGSNGAAMNGSNVTVNSVLFDTANCGAFTMNTSGIRLLAGGSIATSSSVTSAITLRSVTIFGDSTFTAGSNAGFKFTSGTIAASTSQSLSVLTLNGAGTGEINQSMADGDATHLLKVIKDGSGTWVFSSNQSKFTGGFVMNGGTLAINASSNGSTSGVLGLGTVTINGGTITSSSATPRNVDNILKLGGNFTFADAPSNAQTLTFNGATTLQNTVDITISGTSTLKLYGAIDDAGSGYGLTKSGSGAGVLNLGGVAHTYHGETWVKAGTLKLNSGGSIDNSSAFTVDSGATFDVSSVTNFSVKSGQRVQGSGTIRSAAGSANGITINSGAVIAPGDGTATLNVNGSLRMATGAIYEFDLDSTGTDRVDVTGTLVFGDGTSAWSGLLKVHDLDSVDPTGQTYTLFSYAGSNPVNTLNWTLDLTGAPQWTGGIVSVNTTDKTIELSGLTLAQIPEPASLLLVLPGIAALSLGLKRRRA